MCFAKNPNPQVEEQKRQAEHEKLEVLKVLEARSREFMREKVGAAGRFASVCAFGGVGGGVFWAANLNLMRQFQSRTGSC